MLRLIPDNGYKETNKAVIMLYLVLIRQTVIFKGNYYQCLEYVNGLEIGADKVSIRSRK